LSTLAPVAPMRRMKVVFAFLIFGLLAVAYLSPMIWMILSSFKNRIEIFESTPQLTFSPTFSNYIEAFSTKGFGANLKNSFIVASLSSAIALVVGVPAAYSLSRHRGRFQGTYLLLLLAARLLPAIVLSVPLFVIANRLGVSGSYFAVIVAHLTFAIPFTVWMMRGFFLAIPKSLDEAALLDGCGPWSAFFRIVLPLTSGGLAATAIFCFINSWNEFLFALILTGKSTATLPVAVPNLMTPIGTFWGQICAVGTVTVIPVLVLAFIVQKYMIRGMTGGALAGD
jgi:multiple sugar transport system permease protein